MFDLETVLRKIPLFKDINYPLNDLVKTMRLESFKETEIIFSEGEQSNSLYIIISGNVLLYTKTSAGLENAVKTLEAADFFGEISFLDGELRLGSAKALKNSIVFTLARKDFLDFLNDNPRVAITIIETLGKRLRQVNIRNKFLIETNRKLTNQNTKQIQIIDDVSIPALSVTKPNGQQAQPAQDTKEPVAPENKKPTKPKGESGSTDITENSLTKSEQFALKDEQKNERKNEKSEDKKEFGSKEMLYNKKASCPICKENFETPKVLSKYIQIEKIDHDFCQHLRHINPLFYEITVCPACGFAFNEEISGMRLKKEQTDEIKRLLDSFQQNNKLKDYSGVRTLEDAIEIFQLTLFCLQNRIVKKSQLGTLHLKIAWLYRFKEDDAQEQKYLKISLADLKEAFEKEDLTGGKTEINTIYLLGVLNMLIGNCNESVKWLDRVLRHPSRNLAPNVVNQARDIWAEVRQKLSDGKK